MGRFRGRTWARTVDTRRRRTGNSMSCRRQAVGEGRPALRERHEAAGDAAAPRQNLLIPRGGVAFHRGDDGLCDEFSDESAKGGNV